LTDHSDHHSDHDIDHLVDGVAKEMTSTTGGDGFARRVSMRIAEAGERQRPRLWMAATLKGSLYTALYTAIVAACVVVITVFVGREKHETQGNNVRLKPDATNVGATNVSNTNVGATRAGAVNVARRETAPLPRIVPISDAPAPAVRPIEIATLDVARLVDVQQIEISPIAIDRIEIAPMP